MDANPGHWDYLVHRPQPPRRNRFGLLAGGQLRGSGRREAGVAYRPTELGAADELAGKAYHLTVHAVDMLKLANESPGELMRLADQDGQLKLT